MKRELLLLILLAITPRILAQVTVDTSSGVVVVKERTPTVHKGLSIYNAYEPGRGKCHLIEYEPNSGDYGVDPDTLYLDLGNELVHVKTMLDAALKYKKSYNFYRFAINLAPYRDVAARLADIFATSPEWNAYLKKAGNLQVADTLPDGNELVEVKYDRVLAASVLDRSNFVQVLNDFFNRMVIKFRPMDPRQTTRRC